MYPSSGDISVISQMQSVMQQDDLRLPPSRSAVLFNQLKNMRGKWSLIFWDQQDKLCRRLLLIKSAGSVEAWNIVVIAKQMKMTFQLVGGNVSLGVLVKSV
jgi:hypothetical protein